MLAHLPRCVASAGAGQGETASSVHLPDTLLPVAASATQAGTQAGSAAVAIGTGSAVT